MKKLLLILRISFIIILLDVQVSQSQVPEPQPGEDKSRSAGGDGGAGGAGGGQGGGAGGAGGSVVEATDNNAQQNLNKIPKPPAEPEAKSDVAPPSESKEKGNDTDAVTVTATPKTTLPPPETGSLAKPVEPTTPVTPSKNAEGETAAAKIGKVDHDQGESVNTHNEPVIVRDEPKPPVTKPETLATQKTDGTGEKVHQKPNSSDSESLTKLEPPPTLNEGKQKKNVDESTTATKSTEGEDVSKTKLTLMSAEKSANVTHESSPVVVDKIPQDVWKLEIPGNEVEPLPSTETDTVNLETVLEVGPKKNKTAEENLVYDTRHSTAAPPSEQLDTDKTSAPTTTTTTTATEVKPSKEPDVASSPTKTVPPDSGFSAPAGPNNDASSSKNLKPSPDVITDAPLAKMTSSSPPNKGFIKPPAETPKDEVTLESHEFPSDEPAFDAPSSIPDLPVVPTAQDDVTTSTSKKVNVSTTETTTTTSPPPTNGTNKDDGPWTVHEFFQHLKMHTILCVISLLFLMLVIAIIIFFVVAFLLALKYAVIGVMRCCKKVRKCSKERRGSSAGGVHDAGSLFPRCDVTLRPYGTGQRTYSDRDMY